MKVVFIRGEVKGHIAEDGKCWSRQIGERDRVHRDLAHAPRGVDLAKVADRELTQERVCSDGEFRRRERRGRLV